MAIVRCEIHPVQQDKCKYEYMAVVNPIGYPNTAAVCGIKDCLNPGYVWLNKDDYSAYENGQRHFFMNTNTIKVKVGDKVTLFH